jgi:glyoxylase I family protein
MEISVHHISISVKDINRSKVFYEKIGFVEKLLWNSPDNSLAISHMRLDTVYLELFNFKENQEMPETANELSTDLPRIGVKHFGIKVSSIEEANNFLIKKGLIKEEMKINTGKTGVRYFFIKDPDGMLLEFVEDKRTL